MAVPCPAVVPVALYRLDMNQRGTFSGIGIECRRAVRSHCVVEETPSNHASAMHRRIAQLNIKCPARSGKSVRMPMPVSLISRILAMTRVEVLSPCGATA